MFSNRARLVGTLNYVANGIKSLDMPRKNLYRNIILEVVGTVNISDVTTPPVNRTGGAHENAFRAINRLELIANGRDTIKSISGQALAMKNLLFNGVRCEHVATGLTVQVWPFGGVMVIPLISPRAVRQIDTLLDSGRLSTLELRATFGDFLDMVSTAPTAYSAFDCDINVSLDETIRLDARAEPFMTYKETYLEKQISGATSAFQVLLGVGNRYRGFLIETESDGEMVDTILNKVTLKSGTDIYFQLSEPALRGRNIQTHLGNIETLTGYYYVDLCPEGRLVDALDASILSQLEFELDVNAPGTLDYVRIYPDEIIVPAAPPGA